MNTCNGREGRHVYRLNGHTVRAYDGTSIDVSYCKCSCGWRSPRRAGPPDAADHLGVQHARAAKPCPERAER